jgi:hypothetical protein
MYRLVVEKRDGVVESSVLVHGNQVQSLKRTLMRSPRVVNVYVCRAHDEVDELIDSIDRLITDSTR